MNLYAIEMIPLNSICLEHRDDILFFCFIYKNNYIRQWREFVLSCPVKKTSKGVDKFAQQDPELTGKYMGYDYVKFTEVVKSIRNIGQVEPIPIYTHDSKIYPCDGAKRTAAMILLGIKPVKVIARPNDIKWKRKYTIDSPYFRNITSSLMNEFLIYRKNLRKELYGTDDT